MGFLYSSYINAWLIQISCEVTVPSNINSLPLTPLQVILCLSEGDPLGHLLLKRCREADYNCCLLHSGSRVMETLEGFREQALRASLTVSETDAGLHLEFNKGGQNSCFDISEGDEDAPEYLSLQGGGGGGGG